MLSVSRRALYDCCRCQSRSCSASWLQCRMASRRASHTKVSTCKPAPSSPLRIWSFGRRAISRVVTAAEVHEDTVVKPRGRLILLDALALLFRAHFGTRDVRLQTKTGEDTSILFHFLRALLPLLELEPPPTHFAVVFDAAGKTFSDEVSISPEIRPPDEFIDDSAYVPTALPARPVQLEPKSFRHEMYPGYKGQRPPTPEPVKEAIKQLRDLLRVMAIPEIIVPGIEADDVIGTLATRAIQEGFHVAIASPDKDFFQLLQPGLQLLRPPKKDYKGPLLAGMVPYTTQSFQEEWDLQPSQFADMLAIAGDAADNVPGIKGVGFKTAPGLLKSYGDLEGVFANASEVTRKALREKLINPENIAAGRLSKKLVTIHTDVQLPPLKFHMDYLTLAAPTAVTKTAVKAAFAELEFSQHEKRLEAIWKSRAQATNGLGKGNSMVWHGAVKPGSEIVQS